MASPRALAHAALSCTLLVATVVGGASAARAKQRRIPIDPERSAIEIVGRAIGLVPARFRIDSFEGHLSLDTETQRLLEAEFTFNYTALTSGRNRRDRRVQEWVEADRYPDGSFKLLGVEETAEEEDRPVAIGLLRLHGREREARFRYQLVEMEEGTLALDAVAVIDSRDWELPPLRVLFFEIHHEVEVRIQARGMTQAP